MVIGRKSPSAIALDDDRMSATHCCLIRSGDRCWAIDLASTNGTLSGGQRRTVHQIPLDKSLVLGSQRVHYVRLTKQTDDRDWQGIANGLQEQLERVERSHRETIEDATIQQAGLLASLRLVHDQQAAEQQRFDTESRRQEDIARAQATQIVHLEDEHHRLQAELAQQQVTLADTAEKDSAHLEELQHCREEVLRLQQERTELDSRLANREQELADRVTGSWSGSRAKLNVNVTNYNISPRR